ncbi:hypothetical protein CVT26_005770 [Gymnopilus dilepis]|uniref:Uncharacterized protein n=1 Tax=Gymnopilus dilepis TaxID=231916 RepID=A0A409VPI0_9AGAR|nr:hypothetical protein CVT26_005770 [Gymnopilus dilepis]
MSSLLSRGPWHLSKRRGRNDSDGNQERTGAADARISQNSSPDPRHLETNRPLLRNSSSTPSLFSAFVGSFRWSAGKYDNNEKEQLEGDRTPSSIVPGQDPHSLLSEMGSNAGSPQLLVQRVTDDVVGSASNIGLGGGSLGAAGSPSSLGLSEYPVSGSVSSWAQSFREAKIRTGDGHNGGRGGDVGSHNITTSTTIKAIHAQQVVVNTGTDNPSTTQKARPLLFSTSLPPPPSDFVGRDNLVMEGAIHLTLISSPRVAILGHGGIGKTSLALAILHHESAKAFFGQNQFFVPCDTLKSGYDLALAITQILGSAIGEKDDLLMILKAKLSGLGRLLLVLDNFETPWLESQSLEEIERILGLISSIKLVALIITMRGDVPPPTIVWTSVLPENGLQPLGQLDARYMYLSLQQSRQQPTTQIFDDLDALLKAVDYVPLAITLLAAQGRLSTPADLLKRWTKLKTKLLKTTAPQSNKLTNISVSINLSLNSSIMQQNSQCLKLLGVIAFLPAGIPHWRTLVEELFPQVEDPPYAVDILCQTSLVFRPDTNTITMLSPTRHYINEEFKAEVSFSIAQDGEQIFQWINGQVQQKSETLLKFGLANISHVVVKAVQRVASEETINTALDCSEYLRSKNIFSLNMMEEINAILAESPNLLLQAKTKLELGNLLYKTHAWSKAEQVLLDAQKLYCQLDNQLGIARTLNSLGDALRMMDKYSEAADKHRAAYHTFFQLGDKPGMANSLRGLGDALKMMAKYSEAANQHRAAYEIFSQLGNQFGIANSLDSLGDTLRMMDKYSEAADQHKAAYEIFSQLENQHGMANSLDSLGDALRMMDKYSEAANQHRAAYQIYSQLEDQFGMANSLDSLGGVLRMMDKYSEAAEQHRAAYQIFSQLESQYGMANTLHGLGNALRSMDKYSEAEERHRAAYQIYSQIGNQLGMANSLHCLGRALHKMDDYSEAADQQRAAYKIYSQIEDKTGMANSLVGVGDALKELGEVEEAEEQFEQARALRSQRSHRQLE